MDLYEELRNVVEALDRAGVPYLLVGGVAVSIYTAPRATEDIDLMIHRADLPRAIEAIQPLGFRIAGRPMSLARGRLQIQRLTKIQGTDLLPLDLLLPVDPEIAALLDDRSVVDVAGRRTSIVGLRGLRALKRLRGSALDRADLEALGPDAGPPETP